MTILWIDLPAFAKIVAAVPRAFLDSHTHCPRKRAIVRVLVEWLDGNPYSCACVLIADSFSYQITNRLYSWIV